ncbi:MAG: DNA polymerase IV [Anaerolineae bacterium]|nr:MAG: DNA polymerase IV [Anaerolineae bacterium]
MPRTILHLDLDAFFCAVEELRDPGLRGKPFAVGGRPEARGVVASCSYAARARGVRSAMPMRQAMRLCPDLLVIPPHRDVYEEVSAQVMLRLRALSPLVEQISIDEAFVDLSDLSQPAVQIARQVQSQIWDELHLPCSIGVAANKLVAKIATEVGKKAARGSDYPRALVVVPAGEEAAFLAPLPVSMLWGVGPKTEQRLAALGIRTIGELAAYDEHELTTCFGVAGSQMWQHARGFDARPVITEHVTKSISQETTFAHDVADDKMLEQVVREMAAKVGKRLRRENLAASTVKLKLRWPNFTTLTRQITLPTCTDLDEDIGSAALHLLHKVRQPAQAVRLIGVGVSGLGEPIRQISLWKAAGDEKKRAFHRVFDDLQDKYGEKIVKKGA